MNYPDFFNTIPFITVQDKLARVLGAATDGLFTYTYYDTVKLAGHSCPTTAGAFMMLQRGLAALYPDSTPQRGEIAVAFKEDADINATGVIGAIATLITGAADEKGFRGLAGNFARHDLLSFGQMIPMGMRLTRKDTMQWVDIGYDPSPVVPDKAMPELMKKIIAHNASAQEQKAFGILWQKRVEEILRRAEKGELVTVQKGE